MFNNLIESSSHTGEFKRRGSFVLFTMATYALLFIVAGVASIYAYDARLEDQNLQITMLSPLDLTELKPAATTPKSSPPKGSNTSKPTPVVRANNFVDINRPDLLPATTSVKPNPGLPVPTNGIYQVGPYDSGSPIPGGNGSPGVPAGDGNDSGGGGTPKVDVGTPPPAQPPISKPVVAKIISKGPITGLAILLPKPPYPPIARQARAFGPVNVQVLIDETGKVISAKAVSGHPLLLHAALQAAYGARFSPTRLGDQAVKVSGVITYNFLLQ
jgi:protein TonB